MHSQDALGICRDIEREQVGHSIFPLPSLQIRDYADNLLVKTTFWDIFVTARPIVMFEGTTTFSTRFEYPFAANKLETAT